MTARARDLEIVEMVKLINSGELSSSQIVESCMEVIEAYNKTLKAFISINKRGILSQSRKIDARTPKKDGLLTGIPIAIKDLIDVAGQVTTSGSSFFRNAAPAGSDAPIVKRLRKAGAVIFGKTNLHEFAWGGTSENPHYGFCRNPWNPEYSSGGSSGGNGVAIAARMVPGAMGTDTLGSIRIPSSFCGVVGLKPTFGLLPVTGIFPLAYTFDHVGPMARTVADVEIIFRALLDNESRKLLARNKGLATASFDKPKRLEGIKIGCMPAVAVKEICHETVWQQYRKALELAEAEGAIIIDEHLPDFDAAMGAGFTLVAAQASEIHFERMAKTPDGFGEDVRSVLELGYMASAVDYIRAQRLRVRLVEEGKRLVERVDVLITPTTLQPAPRIGQPTDPMVAYFTGPIDVLGFPSIAIPSGLTGDRLPVSLQITTGPYRENLLLDIASVLEDRLAFPKALPAWIASSAADQ